MIGSANWLITGFTSIFAEIAKPAVSPSQAGRPRFDPGRPLTWLSCTGFCTGTAVKTDEDRWTPRRKRQTLAAQGLPSCLRAQCPARCRQFSAVGGASRAQFGHSRTRTRSPTRQFRDPQRDAYRSSERLWLADRRHGRASRYIWAPHEKWPEIPISSHALRPGSLHQTDMSFSVSRAMIIRWISEVPS